MTVGKYDKEIEWRLGQIKENEMRIKGLEANILDPDKADLGSLRQMELRLRQENIIYRREIRDFGQL